MGGHKGLFRYDGYTEIKIDQQLKLGSGWIRSLSKTPEGQLLITSQDNGLWLADTKTGSSRQLFKQEHKSAAADYEDVFITLADSVIRLQPSGKTEVVLEKVKVGSLQFGHDAVYAFTDKGIYQLQRNRKRLIAAGHYIRGTVTTTGLVGISNDAASIINHLTGSIRRIPIVGLTDVAPADPGFLWVIQEGEVHVVTSDDFQKVRTNVLNRKIPRQNILVDHQGSLWVFSINDVYQIPRAIFEIPSPSLARSPESSIGRVGKDIILAFRGAGLFKLNQFALEPLNEKLPADSFSTVIYEHNNKTLIGTEYGVQYLDGSKKVELGYVLDITMHENKLYVATDSNGFFILDNNLAILEHYTVKTGLTSNEVLRIKVLNGIIWVVSANGIQTLEGGQLKTSTYPEKLVSKLSDINLLNGQTFVSTYGSGIYKLVQDNWVRVPSPDAVVASVVFDDKLYVAAREGLCVITIEVCSSIPGVSNVMFSANSLDIDAGMLIAAGMKGVVMFNINALAKDEIQPKLSWLRVNEKLQTFLTGDLEVEHGDTIKLGVTGNDFLQKNRRWRLQVGSDSYESSTGEFVFPAMREGYHSITLSYQKMDGEWHRPYSMEWLNVKMPFYKNAAAIGLYIGLPLTLLIVGLLAALTAVRMYRTQIINMESKSLDHQIHEIFGLASHLSHYLNHTGGLESGQAPSIADELLDKLLPLTKSCGALGNSSLENALNLLAMKLRFQHNKTESEINLCCAIPEPLQELVYRFVFYTVHYYLNDLKASKIEIYIESSKGRVIITGMNNGIKRPWRERLFYEPVNLHMLKDVAEKLQANLDIKSNGNFEMALGNAKVH